MTTASTHNVSRLLETLAAQLERPRELSARVLNYIGDSFSVDHDALGAFLVDGLLKLEDVDIDLILSPVFTPKLADQVVIAELLGGESLPRDQWPALIQDLVTRPTIARLVTSDGRSHSVPLREVTVERFVHRLRLDGAIGGSLLELIAQQPPGDQPLLKAIARRAVWESEASADILSRYLANAAARGAHLPADAVELLDMVESHKPANVDELLARIPPRQQVLRTQIDSGAKPFFSARIQEMHGGDRDQRRQDESGMSVKEKELAFLERLQRVLRPY